MPRMRLKTAMMAIAVLALLLGAWVGLGRRARRFEALALRYGKEANRIETLWVAGPTLPPGEPDMLMEQIHWNDSVANAFRLAASRPWVPGDPRPLQITCECGFHAARHAATTKPPAPRASPQSAEPRG